MILTHEQNIAWMNEMVAKFVLCEMTQEEMDDALSLFHEKKKEIDQNDNTVAALARPR